MPMKVTSYYHRTNPDEAGYSLGNFFEIWGACFDAAGVQLRDRGRGGAGQADPGAAQVGRAQRARG